MPPSRKKISRSAAAHAPHAPRRTLENRLLVYGSAVCVFAVVVIVRLFCVAVGDHAFYVAEADSQHSYTPAVQPSRGEIFVTDRYSQTPYPVATNATEDTVYAVPTEVTDADEEADQLAAILGADANIVQPVDQPTILQELVVLHRAYVPIAHDLSSADSAAITAASLDGIFLEPQPVRYYPEGAFMSQALGFVGYPSTGDVKVGLYGIERYMQKDLAGSVSADGTVTNGSSLLLTVDRSIQHEVESVLDQVVQQHGADSGNAIVADPRLAQFSPWQRTPRLTRTRTER